MRRKTKSKYPLHLESMMEKYYRSCIKFLAPKVMAKVLKDESGKLRVDENIRDDWADIDDEYEEFVYSPKSEEYFKRTFKALATWTALKIIGHINQAKIPRSEKNIKGTIIENAKPTIEKVQADMIAKSREMALALGREYTQGVSIEAARALYEEKATLEELRDALLKYTDNNISKAEFWARDQMGNAWSSYNKAFQTEAGIEKFIWRTMLDDKVRDSHAELEGRVFDWETGAADTGLLDAPGAAFCGDDWNCRCTPEPYIEKQQEEAE